MSKLLKHGSLYTVSDALFGGIPVLLTPLIISYLAPIEFAKYTNLVVLMTFSSVIIDFGSSGYFGTKFHNKVFPNINIYQNSVVLMSIITIILFLFSYIFIEELVGLLKVDKMHIYISLFIGLCTSINALYLTELRFKEHVIPFVTIRMVQVSLHALLAIVLVISLELSWIGRYLSHYVPIFLLFLWVAYYNFRIIKNGIIINLKNILPQLFFGLSLMPHALSSWIKTALDRFFLSDLSDLTANGIYSAAFQISMIFALVGIGFNKAFAPEIYKKLSNSELGIVKKLLNKFLIINVLFSAFIILLLLAIGDKVLSDNYSGVIDILPYLLIGQGILNVYIVYSNMMFYYNLVIPLSLISAFSALIHICMLYYLIIPYKELGAAISFLISAIIQTVLTVIYLKTKVNFNGNE